MPVLIPMPLELDSDAILEKQVLGIELSGRTNVAVPPEEAVNIERDHVVRTDEEQSHTHRIVAERLANACARWSPCRPPHGILMAARKLGQLQMIEEAPYGSTAECTIG